LKGTLAIILLALLIIAIPVIAQEPNITAVSNRPSLTLIGILGRGIAANPADAMDFMIVKFGIATARINNKARRVGIVKIDDIRYVLRNISIADGHATGRIYKNASEVGSFDVSSVMKGDTEIWAGTMDLDGTTYHLYVIEGVRPIKAAELKEKVVEYCNKTTDTNCRDRLRNYCQDHPNDARCRALFRAWCVKGKNMDDSRCRYEFRKWCSKNPRNKYCIPFALNRSKRYCEEHSDSTICKRIANATANLCQNNPDNEGCATVKYLIAERPNLLRNVQALRTRIQNIRTTATRITRPAISADLEGEV